MTQQRQTRLFQVEEPTESIWKLLRDRVSSGDTAEEATSAVLAPYGELGLASVARPAILRAAEIEARNHSRRIERRALDPVEGKSEEYRAQVERRLARATFRVDGVPVAWEDATLAQHKARVMMLEAQIMGTKTTMDVHLLAIELIEEYGVDRLASVPDWQNLLRQRASAHIGQAAQEIVEQVAAAG